MRVANRAKTAVHKILDRYGFSLVRKEHSNLRWFYPIPVNSELPMAPFLYERFFDRRNDGVFVEVGAFDGYNFSNTYGLALRGWSGYLIEPEPTAFRRCAARYEAMANVVVSNCAISDGRSDSLLLTKGELLTTSNSAQADAYRATRHFQDVITEEVFLAKSCTLDSYLEDHRVPPGFELLVVDVEGATGAVFAGFTLDKWRPQMMIIELFDLHPALSATSAADVIVRRQITAAGYEVIHKDSINTIFTRSDVIDARILDAHPSD